MAARWNMKTEFLLFNGEYPGVEETTVPSRIAQDARARRRGGPSTGGAQPLRILPAVALQQVPRRGLTRPAAFGPTPAELLHLVPAGSRR